MISTTPASGAHGALRLGRHRDRVHRPADDPVPNVIGDTVHQADERARRRQAWPRRGCRATRATTWWAPSPPSARRCRPAPPCSSSPIERTSVALPFDPSCDLCEAARLSEWHHEDDVCWVADCEVCGVPMVVWRHHGPTPPDARHRAHAGPAEPGGRRPLRSRRVVDRPGDAPDPQPLSRARTRPALVVADCEVSERSRRNWAPVGCPIVEVTPVEPADALLDPSHDPGGGAMGTLGDGSVETNWFALLHRRVTARAVRSPRYQWWALVALLSGLLALNITFTVFVVALPTVKADFHTNLSVLAWVSTGPLLAFGVAAPFFGKVGDLFGHRRLYQFGLLGAMVSAVLTALAPRRGAASLRPGPRRGAGRGDRHRVDGDHPRALRPRGPGQGAGLVVPGRGGRPGARRHAGLAGDPVLRVAHPLLGPARAAGHRLGGGGGAAAHDTASDGGATRTGTRAGPALERVGGHGLGGQLEPGRRGDRGDARAQSRARRGLELGWPSTWPGAVAVVLGALFIWRETTFATPLVPTTYWRRRNFMFPMATKTFTSFAYFGGFFLFPLLMEQVYGYSVSQVGLHLGGPAPAVRDQRARRRVHDRAHGRTHGHADRHRVPVRLHAALRHAAPDRRADASSWSPWRCPASAWGSRNRPRPRPCRTSSTSPSTAS